MSRVSKRQYKKECLSDTAFIAMDQKCVYFLGLLYADGSLYKRTVKYNTKKYGPKEVTKYHLKLDLSDEDIVRAYADYVGLSEFVHTYQQKMYRGYKRKMMYRVEISNEQFIDRVISLGLSFDKSMEEKIPNIDENLLNHFIRGLLDGDGSISTGNRVEIFTTGEITDWISKKMYDMGFDHTVYEKYRGKSGVTLQDISLRTRNGNAIKFLDWLYEDAEVYIDRKYQKYLVQKKEHECGAPKVIDNGEDVL